MIQTVDLPAHNVGVDYYGVDYTTPAIVGGPECWADPGTDSYVELRMSGGAVRLNGGLSTSGLGFEQYVVPAGATVQDVSLVALAYRVGGRALQPGEYDTTWEQAATVYPTLAWLYQGDPYQGCYNADPVPENTYGEVFSKMPVSQWHYVLDSPDYPGDPVGFTTLAPRFYCGPDSIWPRPTDDPTLRVAYVAIRITIDVPAPAITAVSDGVRRIFGRAKP